MLNISSGAVLFTMICLYNGLLIFVDLKEAVGDKLLTESVEVFG